MEIANQNDLELDMGIEEDIVLSETFKRIFKMISDVFVNLKVGEKQKYKNGFLYRNGDRYISFETDDKTVFSFGIDKFGTIKVGHGNKSYLFFPEDDEFRVFNTIKLRKNLERGVYFNVDLLYTIDYKINGKICIRPFNYSEPDNGYDIEFDINTVMRANQGKKEWLGFDGNVINTNSTLFLDNSEGNNFSKIQENIHNHVRIYDLNDNKSIDSKEIGGTSEPKISVGIKIIDKILFVELPYFGIEEFDFEEHYEGISGEEIISSIFDIMGKKTCLDLSQDETSDCIEYILSNTENTD